MEIHVKRSAGSSHVKKQSDATMFVLQGESMVKHVGEIQKKPDIENLNIKLKKNEL